MRRAILCGLATVLLLAAVPWEAALAGPCDYSWQTDSAGHRCGNRAASRRPGGYEPPGSMYDH